ncbi:efflux transporter outer membrane subunit [Pseudomonas sp. 22526]|uniref:efflux transporter outer membrane subunit n=1 Tax=Pseudomonas sp. 22526 TaxID=3453937 RepID=UPI003F85E5F9
MKSTPLIYAALPLALLLAGCSLAPRYERPPAPIAATWEGQAATPKELPQWQAFVLDPDLRALVDSALANNRSLRQSLLDIEAARAQYRIQRADRLPGLNASGSGNRQRLPADLSSSQTAGVSSTYQVGLSLPEYEIDLFGRVRNLSDAALEQYLATEEATRASQLALISEVIQAYLTWDGAQRQLALTRDTLRSREQSLELIGQRRTIGTATALDYQEAQGLVEQSRADLENTDRQLRLARNALTLLVGTPNALHALPAQPGSELLLVQDMLPGAPSELLARRPDVLASEHRLKARHADIGAARAAFFPRITLSGSLGTSSSEMSGLFDGGSRSWSFLPSLSIPIFAGGRNRASLDLAEVRKDSAVAAYEGTLQQAFREVADALAASDTLRREEAARQGLTRTSQATLALAKARYDSGLDDHLRYLDAQRSAFNDQSTLIRISTQRQIALVDLFRAMGGGWDKQPL